MSKPPRVRRTVVATARTGAAAGAWQAFLGSGAQVAVGGNQPLTLDDDRLAWVVRGTALHVFAVRRRDSGSQASEDVSAARTPLFTVQDGELLLGTGRPGVESGLQLVVAGGPEASVVQLPADGLLALAADPEVGGRLETWVERMTAAAASEPGPRDADVPDSGEQTLPQGTALRGPAGLLWLRLLAGTGHFLGSDALELTPEQAVLPLPPSGWLVAGAGLRMVAGDAVRPDSAAELTRSLELFHSLTLRAIHTRVEESERSEAERLARRSAADRAQLAQASFLLASSFDVRPPAVPEPPASDPLLAACLMLGVAQGIEIAEPTLADTADRGIEPLDAISRASRIRTRRVKLAGQWWRGEHGPILGFARRDGGTRPVALLPASRGGYVLAEPGSDERPKLTTKVGEALEPYGYVLYRPFSELPVSAGELLRFSLRGARRDVLTIALYGLLGGLLALALPLITAPLFNEIIPTGNQRQLALAMAGLTVAALATGALQIGRGVVQVRAEGRADSTLQSALWDRLLKLPAPFFRHYTAGDLASRAMGLTNLRQILSGTVSTSVLTGVFSLFSFALLFFYNPGLALVAVAVVVVGLGASVALISRQLGTLRALNVTQNRLAGTTLQFLTGIPKIRIAGAEPRAFEVWARQQAEQSRLASRAQYTTIRINVILAALPLLSTMLIFGAYSLIGSGMQTGTFIAFTTAYAQGLLAMLGLGMAATTLAQAVPLYESARPILEAVPEVGDQAVHPGVLRGGIEVTGLTFRYMAEAPPALDDVSFRVAAGEFLALVGPSGSGKSTIMRLLLGFESPESGSIHYDGHDLASLDLQAVRRQLGVVLQTSRVFPGSILQNIVGTSALTLDDAWEAAILAGLDEDIRTMPMGMQTFIVEGGSTLSGGQRQQLLIARAIVQRPRILLFDEATSALDNQTQAIVSRALDSLKATRIVIAHRLSTIMHADRICVLVDGRIVESGGYEELMSRPGPFQDLAKRQVL
ncbi:MAG: NHLP bacteriocin export ABC transporter permease/ATPase subunit [Candidatus Nephthysia bennettiae]|uniref:NHLP bacteriocin export ABC transporter permease/ATPase subunit n=1 Tax=Candidatus Nephthysia bennettiae TaxID=3127016 RepID=A0A934K6E0_9BACT|nr:NHLP bacteriocin export ABC transporter permease/ATPase subunit [Candidatus Dormibacteraeota bacterium]MBJ7614350.1 NHLP bacteriocin export ABC transporter permease/ATPase subunit [Candidatus Dormibacteraeota bacterium]PZR85959.1 MAG: NHLP bacteriocin export ABC transporter permease/ATPase subunit [Candidatus Dormibacteraeota bacterium]